MISVMDDGEDFGKPLPDPYKNCPAKCSHDLSRGVLVSEILSDSDGQFRDVFWEKVVANRSRGAIAVALGRFGRVRPQVRSVGD